MDDFSESQVPYKVSIWEGLAVVGGAMLIIATGLAGLGLKALGNAFNPQRAEAIAQSVIGYQIPGGSQGFFGANIGGGKIAVVTSTATVTVPSPQAGEPQFISTVELFFAQMPLEEAKSEDGAAAVVPPPENELFSGFSFAFQDPAQFQIQQAQTEQKAFCGTVVSVEMEQGQLTLNEGSTPIPAVKYELKRVLETQSQVIVISTVGDQAKAKADQVFASLSCK
jgi:hypothetical protein